MTSGANRAATIALNAINAITPKVHSDAPQVGAQLDDSDGSEPDGLRRLVEAEIVRRKKEGRRQ